MRLTFPKFLGVILVTVPFLVLGFFLIVASYDAWHLQEMVLRRRRVVPRLLTFAANPTEFVLRSLFLASLGFLLFSSGFIFLAAFIERLWVLKTRIFKEAFQPRLSMWFYTVPLLSFVVWFALLWILLITYD